MIPGRALHRLADCICSAKAMERCVEPAIADLQNEYTNAVAGCAHVKRLEIVLTGYAAVLKVIAMCALERHTIAQMLLWVFAMTVGATTVVVLLTLAIVPGIPPFFISLLAALVLPIAIPAGVALGIAFALGGSSVSPTTARTITATVVVAGALAVGAMFANLPVASYSVRQTISDTLGGRGAVVKAATELSAMAIEKQEAFAPGGDFSRWPGRYAWTRNVLLAIPFATPVLALFAVAAVRRGAPRTLVIGGCATYFILLLAGEPLVHQGMPAVAAAWLANLLIAAAAVILLKLPISAPGRPA
jgi:hypothetical protein